MTIRRPMVRSAVSIASNPRKIHKPVNTCERHFGAAKSNTADIAGVLAGTGLSCGLRWGALATVDGETD
jgi:hypothetical protein